MLDMDIINAAMVRSRTDPEAAAEGRAANAVNAKKTELGQEDFLALMVAQLKNQDPFKPMDPSQYVGQLAQFSSVSGLASMNQQITSLTNSLRGNQVLDGAGAHRAHGRSRPRQERSISTPPTTKTASCRRAWSTCRRARPPVQLVVKETAAAC